MNPDPVYERLRELSWRRPPTAAEQAHLQTWLGAHPEAQAEVEVELALAQALRSLPEAPVPSNFTARVWQTIERTDGTPTRATGGRTVAWWRDWFPRFAVATVVVGAGLLVYRHNEAAEQVELVKNFLAAAGSPALADPNVIEDFDVICQLRPPILADNELLKLME